MNIPRIVITAGDPAGIGHEIVCKFLQNCMTNEIELTIIAHKEFIDRTFHEIMNINPPSYINIIEPDDLERFDFEYGKISPKCGKASMQYIERAVNGAMNGEFDAIVTCPINKKAIKEGGYDFIGHTEYLAYLSGAKNVSMLLAGNHIKTILATTHYPISEVANVLKPENIVNSIINAFNAGKYFGVTLPKIALCALNPHAGDNGAIGDEETTIIKKAIEEAALKGYNASGPYPADTLFVNAKNWDFIIAMYHDQGMIPIKMDSFGEAVNITLNLPFIRTSVDHGTAFDIAGKNIASYSSLNKAVQLAKSMSNYDKSFRNV